MWYLDNTVLTATYSYNYYISEQRSLRTTDVCTTHGPRHFSLPITIIKNILYIIKKVQVQREKRKKCFSVQQKYFFAVYADISFCKNK